MPDRLLGPKGLLTFYADESDDKEIFVLSSICIPTLTPCGDSSEGHMVEWDQYHAATVAWRKMLKQKFGVPIKAELKGTKIAKGRNNYRNGKGRIYGPYARSLYDTALQGLTFLPAESVFSVYAVKSQKLYGYEKLEASLFAVLQRIQRKCGGDHSALLFFDEGHPEYLRVYRKARVYMPTGSRQGTWPDGKTTKNIPLDAAIKDANFKNSKECYFTQIADLIAYATLTKARAELNRLSPDEVALNLGSIHDSIPKAILNTKVTRDGPRDGIVRIR
jgi:Protein of unknown function (DUF3800)